MREYFPAVVVYAAANICVSTQKLAFSSPAYAAAPSLRATATARATELFFNPIYALLFIALIRCRWFLRLAHMKTKRNPCLCCAFDPGTRDLYTIHYTLGRCLSGLCARLCLSRANFVFANRTTCSWHPDHRSYSLFLLSLSGVRVSGLFAPAPRTRDRCPDRGLKLRRFYLSADE
ncbi:hypothetical protein KQX54_002896 [Cotesia glomerata]|uniref:Secreted protein n=1 Tax=Cotesia glomerata TaxID=32391 RepID=A0AAV7J672_COTGL|nr:hypothetical protein KQX54_002896 [Cotesia glomerata]